MTSRIAIEAATTRTEVEMVVHGSSASAGGAPRQAPDEGQFALGTANLDEARNGVDLVGVDATVFAGGSGDQHDHAIGVLRRSRVVGVGDLGGPDIVYLSKGLESQGNVPSCLASRVGQRDANDFNNHRGLGKSRTDEEALE